MSEGLGLLTDFSVIMVVAGVVSILFHRLHLPVVLGYLVAGLIVGPYTPPFPLVRDSETIRQLADFGIILLLFSLGLDFNLNRLRQVGIVATIATSLEIISALFLGYGVGRALGWGITDSLFLAAALSISSTAIVVKILADMGKTNLLSSRITFGILILEDFVAVLLMVLLSGFATTKVLNWPNAGMLTMRLIVLAGATIVLGRLLVPRLLDLVAKIHSREILVVATLGMCFSMALITHFLGLSVAAGAFLIGAIISESRHMDEIGRLLAPIRDMFGALFFVSMGMLVDVTTLGQYWGPVLIVATLAIVGKVIFASLGTYISGYDAKSSLRVGMALSQRGEFSLIIAKIGQDTQAISSFVYPVVASVTLVTTIVSPLLMRASDGIADRISHLAPSGLKEYGTYLGALLHAVRRNAARQTTLSHSLRHGVSAIAINLLIIGVFLLSGSLILEVANPIAVRLRLPQNMINAGIGIVTFVLSLPSALMIWRSLKAILNGILASTSWGNTSVGILGKDTARMILRNTILLVLLTGMGVVSLPLILRLVGMGLPHFIGLSGLAIAAIIFLLWRSLKGFHRRIEQLYRRSLLGDSDTDSSPKEDIPPAP